MNIDLHRAKAVTVKSKNYCLKLISKPLDKTISLLPTDRVKSLSWKIMKKTFFLEIFE